MLTRTRLTSLADATCDMTPRGVTFGDLLAAVGGANAEWLEGWLRAQVRSRSLVLRQGRYFRPHAVPKVSDDALGPRHAPAPAKPKPPSKRQREREAKAIRAIKRQELHDYWAGLIKRWLAGEDVVGEDMRRARKWWTKLGRPQL